MQYCSLQHQALLLSPVTSTTGWCFCCGSIPSLFLELFLHWSPVAYWHLPTWGFIFQCPIFLPSCCSCSSQGKNTKVVCHSLLQWTAFCQTSPPWPFHLGWPYTAWLIFIELDKAVAMWSDGYLSVIVVSVYLPSDVLSQRLPSYLCFSYLGHGVAPLSCSVLLHCSCAVPW